MFSRFLIICAAITAPAFAVADDAPNPLTYTQFEAAIPHIDLETCPEQLAGDDTFCRVTINHDEIHVFAFSLDGDSPMTGFASYPANDLHGVLN